MVGALTGCTHNAEAPRAQILDARLVGETVPVLEAELDLRFSPQMLEAMDRGIPLALVFHLSGREGKTRLRSERRLQLRYLALARRYEALDLDTGNARIFPSRTQLLAALDQVRLPLDAEWSALRRAGTSAGRRGRIALTLELDQGALPGPLRLPALVSADWRLAAPEFVWQSGG